MRPNVCNREKVLHIIKTCPACGEKEVRQSRILKTVAICCSCNEIMVVKKPQKITARTFQNKKGEVK